MNVRHDLLCQLATDRRSWAHSVRNSGFPGPVPGTLTPDFQKIYPKPASFPAGLGCVCPFRLFLHRKGFLS
jgi:hypothetical protein